LATNCSKSAIFDGRMGDVDDKLDMDHVAECPQCAQLLDGHRNLALAFQSAPRCSPSIHFNRELRNRLQSEQRVERQFRLRTAMLRAYWLLAALASLLILWVIPWPSQVLSGPVVASIGAFLGLVAIVPAMIYRGLGLDRSLFS
jgi:hypothetical protein